MMIVQDELKILQRNVGEIFEPMHRIGDKISTSYNE